MAKTLIGVTKTQEQAQRILDELRRQGFSAKHTSMVLPKTPEIRQLEEEQTQPRRQGAAVGAAAGGVLGILIGLATFAIPGLDGAARGRTDCRRARGCCGGRDDRHNRGNTARPAATRRLRQDIRRYSSPGWRARFGAFR